MEEVGGMALVAGWIWLSIAGGLIMEQKGRSALLGGLLGVFFTFLGLIACLVWPPAQQASQRTG
jgi:hypothetical protein